MNRPCAHSCRNLCNALEVAEHREREAIKEYKDFRKDCDYPDVREMLEGLIRDRERGLARLQEVKSVVSERFSTLDRISDSFG
jgi:rubrerythrin